MIDFFFYYLFFYFEFSSLKKKKKKSSHIFFLFVSGTKAHTEIQMWPCSWCLPLPWSTLEAQSSHWLPPATTDIKGSGCKKVGSWQFVFSKNILTAPWIIQQGHWACPGLYPVLSWILQGWRLYSLTGQLAPLVDGQKAFLLCSLIFPCFNWWEHCEEMTKDRKCPILF